MRPPSPLAGVLLLLLLLILVVPLRADDWPQWRGPTRDGVWRETGIVESLPTPRIPLLWRAPISSGYSGPTVSVGRVYVTDRVREPEQSERVLCFDAKTGKPIWTHAYPCDYKRVSYPAGPRAAVSVHEGRAYALGAKGHFRCLDAATGALVWKKEPGADYRIRVPIWGIASAPLVDGDRVIVQIGGTDGACVVALDAKTGEERWHALKDRASYSAPRIITRGDRRVLLCWTGDHVNALDPATGKLHWQHPFTPHKMIINVPDPVVQGDLLFLSAFYDGSLMLRLAADGLSATKVWRRRGASERKTDALHCMIGTPILQGDHVYGVDSYGELRCLVAATGDRVWEDQTATPRARWSNIHMVRNGGKVWMFNERGELIICTLDPKGFHEISRSKLLDPTTEQLGSRGGVCWSHPAYAGRCIFARNDKELVCASLALDPGPAKR